MGSSLVYPGIDAAIAAFETGGSPTSAAAQANNPGAIQPGAFATRYGATGSMAVAGGQSIAVFPNTAQGQAAEDALVQNYANQGDTIQQLIQNWSIGPLGTPTQTTTNYINSVASAVGASPSTPVSQLAGVGGVSGATSSIASGISNWFGSTGITWGRIGAFLLGLIAVAGALFLLGKTEIVQTARAAV